MMSEQSKLKACVESLDREFVNSKDFKANFFSVIMYLVFFVISFGTK